MAAISRILSRPRLLAAALLTTLAAGAGSASAVTAGPQDQRPGRRLGEISWTEAERRIAEAPLVILPFGAGAKEHGPHLPMNADLVVAEYLVDRAVEALPVVVAPAITHGWFPAFREFPGTEVADPDVFVDYVMQVARSLVRHGARRLVILNTGIAHATGLPLGIVAREIQAQTGVPTMLVNWDDLETPEIASLQRSSIDGHAGEVETSIHLYLQPERVDMTAAATYLGEGGEPYPGYRPGSLSRDPASSQYNPDGVIGDGTLGDPELGRRVLEIMTEQWLLSLRSFAQEPSPVGR